jgi:hypothetical protein
MYKHGRYYLLVIITMPSAWSQPAHGALLLAGGGKRPAPTLCSRVSKQRVTDGARIVSHLATLFPTILAGGHTVRTQENYTSGVRYFREFCDVVGLDFHSFGDETKLTETEEEIILAHFSIYVVPYPRQSKKALSGEKNTAASADKAVSAVRDHIRANWDRTPGGPPDQCWTLKLVSKSLHKLAPSGVRAPRLPILQSHLRAVKRHLDLAKSAYHRTLWAFFLTCWQGVCRAGDLLRGKKGRGRSTWSPDLDTHAGRLTLDTVCDADGAPTSRRRLTLALKPTKTDPTGERGFEKTFIIDHDPHALSAGAALSDMLTNSPLRGSSLPLEDIPLFYDPRTKKELSYVDAAAELKSLLMLCGLHELATGLHSLRIGGTTCAAATGGEYVSSCLGLWSGNTRYTYLHAMRDVIEDTSVRMSRGDSGPLAVRPGPVATYAHRSF